MVDGARRVVAVAVLLVAGVAAGRLVTHLLSQDTGADPVAKPPGRTAGATTPETARPTGAPETRRADWRRRSAHPETGVALGALRAWDRRRAAAYRHGDADALRRLYVPDAPSGVADAQVLRAYAERGLHVTGMRMQVFSLRVLAAQELPGRRHRLRLAVVDRLVGATAVGRGLRRALPRDGPTRHRLVLEREAGRWRVVSVQVG